MSKKFIIVLLLALIICLPIAISAATKYKKLNITEYVYNTKGRLKIKDLLTVTKNAVFNGDIKVKGDINVENASLVDGVDVSDLKLTVDDLSVGQVSLDIASTSGLVLAGNSLSLIDTCSDSQILKFNQASNSWECANDIDTDTDTVYTAGNNVLISEDNIISATDTNTTYTAGNGISLNGTELSVDIDSADVGLGSVENTALSTWAGTSNLTTLGTIATGTWNGASIPDSYIDNNITASSYLPLAGGTMTGDLDIGGSNIKYLSTTDDINTAVANATAGDTLILAAGTYTITDNIDINKSISIIGQGKDITVISSATDNLDMFNITASNVNVQNLSIQSTGGGFSTRGIYVNGSSGEILQNIYINNIEIIVNGSGSQYAIYFYDANGEVRNTVISATSTSANARGVVQSNGSESAEADTAVRFYNTSITSTATGAAISFYSGRNSETYHAKLYIYNCTGVADDFAVESRDEIYIENSIINGSEVDVYTDSTVQLRDTTLVNGTTIGTVTYSGEQTTKVPVTQDTNPAVTLTTQDCIGGLFINNDNDVIDYSLPAAEAGLKVTFGNSLYAQVITVDAAAGDIIVLNDGTALVAGNAIDSGGFVDDKGTLMAIDNTYWIIWDEQNVWVDGGAD